MTDIAKIAAGLTKARRYAIENDKRSRFPVYLTILPVIYGITVSFGYYAGFWFSLGGLISALVTLWEAVRNLQIEEAAVRDYLKENNHAD
jgi:uncharacterized protein (DUF58 family)